MTDRIVKTVEINAPVERVWRALTDHREFGTWFRVRLDGPFVLGEVTRGQMTYPGCEHVPWWSRTTKLEAPHLFSFVWPNTQDPGADFEREPTTLVEFRLEAAGRGSRLTVTESGFEGLPPDKRMTALRDNEKGWAEQMGSIKTHVER
jgi:uncharacterized protein YndB with AHSA1/START domain